MAGTPPATCAVAPASRAAALISRGKSLERLMRRQHVVIGGDDAEIGRTVGGPAVLVARHRRIGMGLVAAGQMRPRRAGFGRARDAVEIGAA
jgi:hypothetical protein